jgi:basic membrane lipoprotein Med (substrate-binding protein (PBP1-ABC) superfamily)
MNMQRKLMTLSLLLVSLLLFAACAVPATAPTTDDGGEASATAAPSEETAGEATGEELIIGALHVGSINDAGYNQAHHAGLVAMNENLPNVKLIEAENVPESADAERVMENMIQQGAKIIFPQSFGYLDPALNVAAKYPDVIFMHPAGFKLADNLGTYWGNNFEAMYLTGIAAGAATESGKLGFITAFPIPNILASVNAFHLGAKSVNPDVETTLVINGSWVDPAKEAAATNALADAGVDVVTMIVDSPVTVVKTAEERGIKVIGFHSDALEQFAPNGWLTGVAYTWGPLFTRIVESVVDGSWTSEHIRGGIESDYVTLANFGPSVSEETKAKIAEAEAALVSGELKIFQGPILDNEGTVRIPEGEAGGMELLDTTDWLVEGVIGQTE